jgi:hypothetical protein
MNKLEQQIERLRTLDLDKFFKESVEATKDSLLGYIRQMHLEGKASDGEPLGYYSWKEYADYKAQYFQAPYGQYNLEDTGTFHNRMYIGFDLEGNIIVSSSDDKKKVNLLVKWSGGANRVFTLGEDLKEYATQVYPIFMNKIRKHLGY